MARESSTDHGRQYTLRGVPPGVDEALRRKAKVEGKSLNRTAVEALGRGLGMEPRSEANHAFDDLAGSWVRDPDCEAALDEMRERIDWELWR